jgi:hypothetical protein
MNFHAPPPAEYGNVSFFNSLQHWFLMRYLFQIRMGKPGLRGERYEVFPVFSRVNNIGESDSVRNVQ